MSLIPKDLLVFDIEDMIVELQSNRQSLQEKRHTLIRRLCSKLNQISNYLRMDGTPCDIYCGVDYIDFIQEMVMSNVVTSNRMDDPNFIGQMAGTPLFRDFTLDKVIEFRKGDEVIAVLNLRNKEKVRRDKLNDLLDNKNN